MPGCTILPVEDESLEELAEIMEEAPGGANYGFRRATSRPTDDRHDDPADRTEQRAWASLERPFRPHDKPFAQPGSASWSDPGRPFIHGTANGYNNRECRCDECRSWRREYVAARRRGVN